MLIVSDALRLEVFPKAQLHRQLAQQRLYEAALSRAEPVSWSAELMEQAKDLACRYGPAAMDAAHLAVVVVSRAEELVSGEKPAKPLYRATGLRVRSLWTL